MMRMVVVMEHFGGHDDGCVMEGLGRCFCENERRDSPHRRMREGKTLVGVVGDFGQQTFPPVDDQFL
jgi:hypothetical protein